MTEQNKKEIASLLKAYVEGCSSQKQASYQLNDVSEATIINILKNNWSGVSDSMWINIGKQVGWNQRKSKLVETMDFNTLVLYYTTAKEHGEAFAIVGPPGSGKSYTGRWYASAMRKQNVYFLECAEFWNKKYFLAELMKQMGVDAAGLNVYEMMDEIVSRLRKQHEPLIIMDEVDKLKDEVLYFFITLYNQLHGSCGIVWSSTDHIIRRIDKGIAKNKKGFREIKSRLGNKYITLRGTDKQEVIMLCQANGITATEEINEIFNDYKGDLRRIDRHYIKKLVRQKFNRA